MLATPSCSTSKAGSRWKTGAIFINLGDIFYIDGGGLGQLVVSSTAVSHEGGSLKLFNLGRQSRDLLAMTKLLMVSDTYESEEDALQSFAQGVA